MYRDIGKCDRCGIMFYKAPRERLNLSHDRNCDEILDLIVCLKCRDDYRYAKQEMENKWKTIIMNVVVIVASIVSMQFFQMNPAVFL